MRIDVSNLFNGSGETIEISTKVDMSNLMYATYNPIKKPVELKGKIYSKADVVYLDLSIAFTFIGFCDRCACDIEKPIIFSVSKILVPSMSNDTDDDEYIVVSNGMFDIEELVNEEIQLYLPSKMLCKPDCKGLCYKCGANLNVKKCDCKPDVDPRMEALLQLLDEE